MIDATSAALEKALGLRMKAHEAHVSNIANSNVPGYKALKVDFDARMNEALEGAAGEEGTLIERERNAQTLLDNVEAEIIEDPLARMSGNGNTVNMEREQTELAKNTIAYETALQLLSKKFFMAKHVLGGGG